MGGLMYLSSLLSTSRDFYVWDLSESRDIPI